MIKLVENIFSPGQLKHIHEAIANYVIPTIDNGEYIASSDNLGTGLDVALGRLSIGDIGKQLNEDIKDRLTSIAEDFVDYPIRMDHILYTEYSNKYGKPNLPPHFDGDTNDFIINMQLSSNTSWDLGLNLQAYTLKDNSALIFNGNTEIHWRKHKEFKDGEYVSMLFTRFYNLEKRSDYSHLTLDGGDNIFKDARDFRDSFKNIEH
jgi:hypothetical protein